MRTCATSCLVRFLDLDARGGGGESEDGNGVERVGDQIPAMLG